MIRHRLSNTRILPVRSMLLAVLKVIIVIAAPATAQNPVPLVDQPLVPDATAPGGAGFTLTVNGAGFVPTSIVNWNGSPRAATFVSKSQLTAAILAADIATVSTATVTVVNPSPGGGVSNTQFFSIAMPKTSASFLPAVTYDAGAPCSNSIAVADVNADGKPDLIVASGCPDIQDQGPPGSISVLLGNGDGTFRPPVNYYSGGVDAASVRVADVNGDGKPDLLVANECSDDSCPNGVVAVLLGNGDGTFQAAVTYDAGWLVSLAVADVNGDGRLDLVVSYNSVIGVLLGNGDGTFQPAVTYPSGALQAVSVAIADVNNDGKPDVIVANQCSNDFCPNGVVGVLLGNGDGTFQAAVTYDSGGQNAISVAVADVNGDGNPDILVANISDSSSNGATGSIGVLLGNGDGTFEPAVTYSSGAPDALSLAVGDLNGDGRPDMVVANCTQQGDGGSSCPGTTGVVGVLLGNGDGTFQAVVTHASGGVAPNSIAIADLNGDGQPDLLVANNLGESNGDGTVGVLLNNSGPRKPATTTTLASSLNPSTYGQTVTFTASVTSSAGTPTGPVIFSDASTSTTLGSATLSGGSAGLSASSLAAGTHSITAAYQGSASFSGSTSAPVSQVVNIAATTAALTSSQNPAGTGQTITFTATVTSQYGGAATGSVVFSSGLQTLGPATLAGNLATLTTSFATLGNYSITAKYNGDSNNSGSTSSALSQKIIASTTTTLVSSLNPSLVGQAVTFTATVSSTAGAPPNGELITFKNGSSVLGTAALSGGSAVLSTSSLSAGIYTVTASYGGDANFAASTSPGLRQVVNNTSKSATSTTLSSSLNPSLYGQSITFKATVTTTGSTAPTGSVNFTWSGYSIGTATLNTSGVATLTKSNLNVYTYPLVAAYSGDANNLPSTSVALSQVVKQTTSAATLTSSPNPSTQGQAVTFTAKITSPTVVPTGPVTFKIGNTILGTAQLGAGKATFTTSTLSLGTDAVTVTYPWNSNITGSSASVNQVVDQ